MRRLLLCAALALASPFGLAAEFPAQAPIDAAEAPARLLQAIAYDGIDSYWLRERWYALDVPARVALVRAGIGWARDYSATPAFAAAYAAERAAARPSPPEAAAPAEQQLAAQREQVEQQIAAMRASLDAFSGEQRKEMEASIEESERAMREMLEDPAMQEYQRAAFEQQAQAAQAEYRQALQEWERQWPQDVRQRLARRIGDFLSECAEIDFAADLQPASGGVRRFSDPALEAKSWSWKLCFRAGREPLEAARAEARAWLQDIGGQ